MAASNPHKAALSPLSSALGLGTVLALLLSALLAASLWHFSPPPAKYTEFFGADIGIYLPGLFVAGFVSTLITPRPIWAHYVGGVIGQAIYALVALPLKQFLLATMAFIALYFAVLWLGSLSGLCLRLLFAAIAGKA